jgi:DivIVA domain-containing protein
VPLTPAEVRHVSFNKPPRGKPGYHEEEVDEFLDRVEAELARLIQENTDLHNQIRQLDQPLRVIPEGSAGEPGPPRPPGPMMPPLRPPLEAQISSDAEHDGQAATVLVLAQERLTS